MLLILVAVTLLVAGLAAGSSVLLISSIAASLLAAVALVVGARRAAARTDADHGSGARPTDVDGDDHTWSPSHSRTGAGMSEAAPPYRPETVEVTVPSQQRPDSAGTGFDRQQRPPGSVPEWTDQTAPVDDEVPADEPAQQQVSPADAARVARLSAEVLVVDGRPRYHLADCPHLYGRDSEPLAVAEAVELGFTPCGRCQPDAVLLADLKHG
ncbi:hypothetical protein GCM10027290_15950 [Micromonospora sonneratiae]